MILFLSVLFLTVVSILYIISYKIVHKKEIVYYKTHNQFEDGIDSVLYRKGEDAEYKDFSAAWIIFGISCFILVILFVILLVNYCNAASSYVQYKETYDVLTYQLDHNFYENIVENGKNDFYTQVMNYNKMVGSRQVLMNNKFIGIFYPKSCWSNLQLINLK